MHYNKNSWHWCNSEMNKCCRKLSKFELIVNLQKWALAQYQNAGQWFDKLIKSQQAGLDIAMFVQYLPDSPCLWSYNMLRSQPFYSITTKHNFPSVFSDTSIKGHYLKGWRTISSYAQPQTRSEIVIFHKHFQNSERTISSYAQPQIHSKTVIFHKHFQNSERTISSYAQPQTRSEIVIFHKLFQNSC